MIVPIILGASVLGLGGLAYYRKGVLKKGVLTPERRRVFEQAMTKLVDASKINKLAEVFEKEGLKAQAHMLRLRARLRSMPPDLKKARKQVYLKTLTLKNPKQVLKVAEAFEKEGATGAAESLRQYAAGLK